MNANLHPDSETSSATSALYERLPILRKNPVIGIIRGYPPESAEAAAKVAFEEGLGLLEVTLDSPDALGVIERIGKHSLDLVIGVGTVMHASQVGPAAEAGAAFVVTPAYSRKVITACAERDLPVISGAATPTEILDSLHSGASAVKVFPAAQLGGPSYLEAIRAPLGDPPLVPTGGVNPENARTYLEHGAVALGAGSSLFANEIGLTGNWDALRRRLRQWIGATS